MPARKIKNKDGTYRVVTPNGVHAKSTTLANANKQVRLLNGIEHNPEFAKQVRKRAAAKKKA